MKKIRTITIVFLMILIFQAAIPVLRTGASGQETRIRVAYWDRGGRYYLENGKLNGCDVDYLNDIAKYTGWKYEYIRVTNPKEAMALLKEGKADLITSMQPVEERKEEYCFSEFSTGFTYATFSTLTERHDLIYEDYEQFSKLTFGCAKNYANRESIFEFVKEKGIDFHYIDYESVEDMKADLIAGRIDAMASGGQSLEPTEKILAKFSPAALYYMADKRNMTLIREIDEAWARIVTKNPNYVTSHEAKYFPALAGEEFTKEELDYIAEKGSVKIGCYEYGKVMMYPDKNEAGFSGIIIDILERISQISGLRFQYIELGPEFDAKEVLATELVDLVVGVSAECNPEALSEYSLVSDILFESDVVLVQNRETAYFDENKKKIALTAGGQENLNFVKDHFSDWSAVIYQTNEACLDAVLEDRAQLSVQNFYSLNTILKQPKYSSISIIPGTGYKENFVLLGAVREPALVSVLDKTINRLEKDEVSRIILNNSSNPFLLRTVMDYVRVYPNAMLFLICLAVTVGFVIAFLLYYMRQKAKQNLVLIQKNAGLAAAMEQAEKADRVKSEFLSNMSHDIRTPLNLISGFTDIGLRETDEKDKLQEYFKQIAGATRHLKLLVDDMLDVDQLLHDQILLNLHKFDLRLLLRAVLQEAGALSAADGIEFHSFIDPKLEQFYIGDEARLFQIMIKLLSNAFQYNKTNGSVIFSAELSESEGSKDTILFRVADTGIGMEKDFLNLIYQPFIRESPDAGGCKGAGLSLTIIKRLIVLMEGRISAESEPEKGTKFEVVLTLEKYTKKEGEDIPKLQVAELPMKGRKVLVAEDNELNLAIAKALLEIKGFDVITAKNGRRALELFSTSEFGEFDVILMDIRMPEMDGMEATRSIRALKRPDAVSIPIYAVSANAYEKDKEEAAQSGMNGHFSKPLDIELICRTIQSVMK